jgi:hypothetical protein
MTTASVFKESGADSQESHRLRRLIHNASKVVETLFEPRGQMRAYFLVERSDHTNALMVAAQFGNAEEEAAFRVGVPHQLRRAGFWRWCFFTEAWTAPTVAGGVLPAQHAERMEIVCFAAEALNGERLFASRQILRLEGQDAKLLPLVFPENPTAFVTAPA